MRFMIEIGNNELILGEQFAPRPRLALSELDAYVKALYAARDFAIANADPPAEPQCNLPKDDAAECGNTTSLGEADA